MEDCDYEVGGAVAAARPVIGNTLRTSGSKGEVIKGVTRHLERRRETGLRKKKGSHERHENVDCTRARPGKSSLIDANIMMTKEGIFTMISHVVVVRHLGGLLCAVGPMVSLFNLSSLHPWGS